MSMTKLEKGLALVEKSMTADFEGAKSKNLVALAEKTLGVTFPATYKKFLETLGCGDINGVEFYGIITDDFKKSSIPDAIWLTLHERAAANLEKNLVLICESDEYYYALDTAKMENNECPVIDLMPETDSSDCEVVAATFGEFFYDMIVDNS